jgi:hypothetical protein
VEHGYPMGPTMGRENALMKGAVSGVLGGWAEHGYPMGPMMGRENALMKSAVHGCAHGVFVGWVEVCRDSCL